MNIVFVGLQYDYGDPRRGPSFEVETFQVTLEAAGHRVTPFDAVARVRAIGKRATQNELLHLVDDLRPDLLLAVPFGLEITPLTYALIRAQNHVSVVAWFSDDHWRYEALARCLGPSLTCAVTTSRDVLPKYARDGIRCILSQWGYAAGSLVPSEDGLVKRSSVVFVGQTYGRRNDSLHHVASSTGNPVRIFGHGTPGGRLTTRQMADLFATATVTLNFSDSWTPGLLSRIRHKQLRQPKRGRQIKARVFEVTGCGGFLLTQDAPFLAEYFDSGSEIAVFRDEEQLLSLLAKAIENPEWRDSIAAAGHRRCVTEHTMAQRLHDVFQRAL